MSELVLPAERSSTVTEARLALVGLGLLLLAALWHLRWLGVVVVDDAAISLRYGLTFFSGGGLRLTPLSPPVEGFSNPLWMFLIGLAGPLDLPPVAFMQALGIAFGLAALGCVGLWGPAAFDRPLRAEDLIAPAVAAANPSYLTWIGSGLETGLEAFLLGLIGVLLLRGLWRRSGAGLGIALGLLCLTRPEAPLLAAAAGLWVGFVLLGERRAPDRALLRAALVVILIQGGYLLVRWGYFADWLPNTYYAKRDWHFDAAKYLHTFRQAYAPACGALLLSTAAALVWGGAARRIAALASLWIACAVLFVWVADGDWMGEWRFFAPYLPLFGVPLAALVSMGRARLEGWRGRAALGAALALVATGASAGELRRSPEVKRSPQLRYSYVAENAREAVDWCRAAGERHPLISLPDLGGLAMAFPQADILDDAGLADYVVAHHANNLAAQEDYLLSEGPPSIIDAHGPSGQLNRMRRLRSRYGHGPRTWWVLRGLTAQEDPRCPGGKAAVLALEGDALAQRIDDRIAAADPQTALSLWLCARVHQVEAKLPDAARLRALSRKAVALGEKNEADHPRLALRAYSLATRLASGDAHLRRRTEKLRTRLFPEPPRAR